VVTRSPTELDFVAGDPALDFANTLGGARDEEANEEFLADYRDLVLWASLAGVIDEPAAERLGVAARRRPDDADRAFERALELRTATVAVFSALATHNAPPDAALADLTAHHADALAHARLHPTEHGFDLAWDVDDLHRPLWPVATAAVDLLRAGPLDRLKLCDHCCWMFLDLSRNRSRRWCSMNHCGGNEKMRRYRARRRATAGR
jgi:predicted RNA-binding Zn ribbon-like protein